MLRRCEILTTKTSRLRGSPRRLEPKRGLRMSTLNYTYIITSEKSDRTCLHLLSTTIFILLLWYMSPLVLETLLEKERHRTCGVPYVQGFNTPEIISFHYKHHNCCFMLIVDIITRIIFYSLFSPTFKIKISIINLLQPDPVHFEFNNYNFFLDHTVGTRRISGLVPSDPRLISLLTNCPKLAEQNDISS